MSEAKEIIVVILEIVSEKLHELYGRWVCDLDCVAVICEPLMGHGHCFSQNIIRTEVKLPPAYL